MGGPETKLEILEAGVALCRELAPPEVVRTLRQATIEDILPLVVYVGCGLWPASKGGIRVDIQLFSSKSNGDIVPVVCNYGHAGRGFRTSWGSAEKALELPMHIVLSVGENLRNRYFQRGITTGT
ncbi:hypothetical protein M378DRAFT_165981 [Amanita muscaria Koide BX008]|uniref:Uncharacterized protein n=1 Tax=Amanita muscaria (strain Koide BX008) TaxID=946122 RepID=A0A0C2SGM7_AMAMK|nr:hypothetical protein M378DRAFT_165981 [Amanita muscaria Koide BX008]